MEVKEAIRRIKDHFRIHDDGRPTPYLDEAVDMAIEALELQEMIKDEFNVPIKDMYNAALLLCMATSLGTDDCSNCPVMLFDYDKRTRIEKCCAQEPCQTNLYKWLMEQAKK